jgi:hypothetical protein
MDDCCQLLAELKEYETDELIPHLVRCQEISRRLVETFSYDDPKNGEVRGEFLIALTSEAFMRDVNHLQLNLPFDFRKNSKNILSTNYQQSC